MKFSIFFLLCLFPVAIRCVGESPFDIRPMTQKHVPFMAHASTRIDDKRYNFNAVIFHKRMVLTNAFYCADISTTQIYVGVTRRQNTRGYSVKNATIHPEYNPGNKDQPSTSNICIMTLSKDLPIGPTIQVASITINKAVYDHPRHRRFFDVYSWGNQGSIQNPDFGRTMRHIGQDYDVIQTRGHVRRTIFSDGGGAVYSSHTLNVMGLVVDDEWRRNMERDVEPLNRPFLELYLYRDWIQEARFNEGWD